MVVSDDSINFSKFSTGLARIFRLGSVFSAWNGSRILTNQIFRTARCLVARATEPPGASTLIFHLWRLHQPLIRLVAVACTPVAPVTAKQAAAPAT